MDELLRGGKRERALEAVVVEFIHLFRRTYGDLWVLRPDLEEIYQHAIEARIIGEEDE